MAAWSCRHSLPEDRPQVEFFETTKPFADVVHELEFAITERNFRITGRNTIGNEIRKRGYPGFPNMEVIHFCNLEYAREMLTLAPRFVAQMPCRITVHEERGRVLVGLVWLPQDQADPRIRHFAQRMNGLLREIVQFAVQENAR